MKLEKPIEDGRHSYLSGDAPIAVGFGEAYLEKSGEIIFREARDCDEFTVAMAEDLAARQPELDWRIHLIAPLSERHYQRQGDKCWVLYLKADGFA